MITENKEPICPISFIEKDKIETRSDINALFLMPYETNLVANNAQAAILTEDKFIDELRKNDKAGFIGPFIRRQVQKSNEECIASYIVSNVADAYTNIFINTMMDVNANFGIGKIDPELPLDFSPKDVYEKVFDKNTIMDLRDAINSIFIHKMHNEIDPDCTFVIVDNIMSQIFAKILYTLIEPFITSTATSIILGGKERDIAKYTENKFFDGTPITKSVDDYGLYTYYTSLIRGIFNENLISFRQALTRMSQSIVWMVFGTVDTYRAITNKESVVKKLEADELGMIPMIEMIRNLKESDK